MRKETLMTRMAPYIRQEYRHNATAPACPSISRCALTAHKALAITGDEYRAIRKAWADCRDTLDEHSQARCGMWEHYAAGIIYNAEATL